ncbi:type II toxin-antitoxin system Phd/YefM family antitoxin, partial [Nocardia cyriacigeorgica]|uniref:type II toxin-antitoxin system Phd/YefM family antitoxin n=1 Tax=Nocardia cyriacigeorgica TaxID=135487 RepID=UPI002457FAD9
MSTHSLRDLRMQLGAIVRGVAATGEEAIITDSGSEVAVIISMADYERLHEHADLLDALRGGGISAPPKNENYNWGNIDRVGVDT